MSTPSPKRTQHLRDLIQARPAVVAEVAQAHDGSLGVAHSFVDAAAEAGADAVKFQMHIAEAESSPEEPFRTAFSYQDATRLDYWRRMEFTLPQWHELKEHAEARGLIFLCSPFSCEAVDRLVSLGVGIFKVGSGEVTDHLLLHRIAAQEGDVILSSGMSTWAELDAAVEFLSQYPVDLAVVQCTTMYPCPAQRVGLSLLPAMLERWGLPVGLSDHSGSVAPGIAAVALGACIVEVHVTFDRRMFGPDSPASLTMDELRSLVAGVRCVHQAMRLIDKDAVEEFAESRRIFGKSLCLRNDRPAGHCLTIDDLETRKPAGCGIPAGDYARVVGSTLRRNVSRDDFLGWSDVSVDETDGGR